MVKDKIITNLYNKIAELKQKHKNITPVLELISALISRAIDENFRQRGRWDGNELNITIFSGGNQRWKPLAKSTRELYAKIGYETEPTLLRTKNLMSSIEVRPYGSQSIIITVAAPYAGIHQYGGIRPAIKITDKMRRYFWYMYYNTKLEYFKAMALTKKEKLRETKIPARPFITLTDSDLQEIVDIISANLIV